MDLKNDILVEGKNSCARVASCATSHTLYAESLFIFDDFTYF